MDVSRYSPQFGHKDCTQLRERKRRLLGIKECDWLIAPAKWDQHLRRASASMILSVVYDSPPLTSEQIQTADDIDNFTHRVTTAAAPGTHLVEFSPWLRHVPSR